MSYAVGGSLAPVIGGGLCDKFGFQSTSDIMSASAFGIGMIYFFLGILPQSCK